MASRDLVVHLIGDDASLQRAYKRSAVATAQLNTETKSLNKTMAGSSFARGGLQGVFGGLGKTGGFLAGATLVVGLKNASAAASNLAEQQNKARAVFGDSARIVETFARTTADSLGIANDQALQATGIFGNLFTTVNLAPAANARLSTSLVKLAADLASFNNASPDEALDALRSGLIGEAEPLRRFGVLLTEARVQQEAMRETGKENARALTAQEKILARYALILKDAAPAQGDFQKTSHGLANQQRILTARLRDNSAALGKQFNPAIQDATTLMIAATGAAAKFASAMNKLPGGTYSGVDLIHDVGHGLGWFGRRVFGTGGVRQGPDVSDRMPGLAPGGPGTFLPGGSAAAGVAFRPRAALAFQMSMLRERFAKAELTATTRDDRATLVLMQTLLHRQITATKDLKLRTQLYEDLVSVNGQIKGIDDKIASDRKNAADRARDARQKELDAQKKKREALAEHNRKLREAWQAQLQKIRDATDAVRSEFGQLPVVATPAGILGVTGQTSKSFVGAYVDQTKAFVRFYNNLGRLGKMGAPAGLVEQLRGLGVEGGAGTVRGLLTHPGQLRRLARAFRERENVAMQIAKADINARVVHIHTGGARPHATTATTRRGQKAGVPLGGSGGIGV